MQRVTPGAKVAIDATVGDSGNGHQGPSPPGSLANTACCSSGQERLFSHKSGGNPSSLSVSYLPANSWTTDGPRLWRRPTHQAS